MSHFTKLAAANITSVQAFIEACRELGMTTVERNVEMKAYDKSDAPIKVEVLCRYPGTQNDDVWSASRYGIGLNKVAPGRYEMISDWSLTGHNLAESIKKTLPPGFPGKDGPGGGALASCEALRGRVTQLTTKHAITQKYKRLGFRAELFEDENHNIDIKLTRA